MWILGLKGLKWMSGTKLLSQRWVWGRLPYEGGGDARRELN